MELMRFEIEQQTPCWILPPLMSEESDRSSRLCRIVSQEVGMFATPVSPGKCGDIGYTIWTHVAHAVDNLNGQHWPCPIFDAAQTSSSNKITQDNIFSVLSSLFYSKFPCTRLTGNEITANQNSPRFLCSLDETNDHVTSEILFSPMRDNSPVKLNDLKMED
ncbi:hypothetical protein TNCV_3712161 [Trichonephila clavipes]|nr:hypothetical protein TNCV_3712161 [Trichonephila clavipes]